jgi:radical SAM superfamily enzyme YgiQ (UPF0313 family)
LKRNFKPWKYGPSDLDQRKESAVLQTATLITPNYRKLNSPPLGVILVAEGLSQLGVRVDLFDLAFHWTLNVADTSECSASCALCADLLAGRDSQFFGFSTIAGAMSTTVRTALELRARRPDAVIGFGGPGVSAVCEAFIAEFLEFDFVLRGEVEGALPAFVSAFGTTEFRRCPNLVYRADGQAHIVSNPLAKLPARFPTPRYDLWGYGDSYPIVPVEVGRGCPYQCKFCCTSAFFSRRYRIKEAPELITEIQRLLGETSPQQVNFVHDLFTVNQERVISICRDIIKSGIAIRWECASRIGCISDELIALMAEAGCRIIVFGIESGSPRIHSIIGKNLPVERTLDVAETCAAHGITMGASFIIGFPEESDQDLNQTLELWLDLMTVRNTEPHGSILVALGGTEYQREYLDPRNFTALHAMALPKSAVLTNEEADLIRAHPNVFPEFYALPYGPLSRQQLKLVEEFMNEGAKTIRYLLVGLRRMGLSGLDIILGWFEYAGVDALAGAGSSYCRTAHFVGSFAAFYRRKLEVATLDPAERTFLEGLAALYDVLDDEYESADAVAGPALAAGVRVVQGSVALSRLPVRLWPGILPSEALRPTWYLHATRAGRTRTLELQDELGEVLSRCDGDTPLWVIARQVKVFSEEAKNASAVAYLVERVAGQGYVKCPPSRIDAEGCIEGTVGRQDA